MENEWLTAVRRIRAIAGVGLSYSDGPFDRERYRELADIAEDLFARLTDAEPGQVRELFAPWEGDYPCPKVDVRAALIEDGKILLVREALDGKWTMPGGFADIGLTPSANAIKECREEAGIAVAAKRLYLVRHKAAHQYNADPRDFYKLYFLCERAAEAGEAEERGTHETTDVAWFAPDAIPELSRARTLEGDIAAAFAAAADPTLATVFD